MPESIGDAVKLRSAFCSRRDRKPVKLPSLAQRPGKQPLNRPKWLDILRIYTNGRARWSLALKLVAATKAADLVFLLTGRRDATVRAARERFKLSACQDKFVIKVRHLFGRVVIDMVEVPANESVTRLDYMIDRNIHWYWTCAPRFPAFDNDSHSLRLQDFAHRMGVRKIDIKTETILMLLDESEERHRFVVDCLLLPKNLGEFVHRSLQGVCQKLV